MNTLTITARAGHAATDQIAGYLMDQDLVVRRVLWFGFRYGQLHTGEPIPVFEVTVKLRPKRRHEHFTDVYRINRRRLNRVNKVKL